MGEKLYLWGFPFRFSNFDCCLLDMLYDDDYFKNPIQNLDFFENSDLYSKYKTNLKYN